MKLRILLIILALTNGLPQLILSMETVEGQDITLRTVCEGNNSEVGARDTIALAWMQTISIDIVLAKQLIESQTHLVVTSIKPLGEGFDNVAYLVNEEFVFRFPRRQKGIESMQNELAVLPYIADKVSFPASFTQYSGQPTDLYAAPFGGYRMLPGISLCDIRATPIEDTAFATTLAHWLKELHAIPVLNEHYLQIIGNHDWRISILQLSNRVAKCIEQFESYFNDAGFSKDLLLSVLAKFQSFNFRSTSRAAYCHGDLYSRHILVDSNEQLSSIIDWGDFHIGQPGTDLSIGIMIFTDEALHCFFNAYGPIDDITYQIALFRSFWHPILMLPYCFEMQERKLKKWTILALKQAISRCKLI